MKSFIYVEYEYESMCSAHTQHCQSIVSTQQKLSRLQASSRDFSPTQTFVKKSHRLHSVQVQPRPSPFNSRAQQSDDGSGSHSDKRSTLDLTSLTHHLDQPNSIFQNLRMGSIDYTGGELLVDELRPAPDTHHPARQVLSELHEANIQSSLHDKLKQNGHVAHYAPPPNNLRSAQEVRPGSALHPDKHFYPNVLNTSIHPTAKQFFALDTSAIIDRYMQLHPNATRSALELCLNYKPKYFLWAGSDLFHVRTSGGEKKMIIVETNSCPAGQKSMPAKSEDRYSGYRTVLDNAFAFIEKRSERAAGELAVIYDKNEMEVGGYASILSEVSKERVWLAEFTQHDRNPPVKWEAGLMYVRDAHSVWHPIRACFRYVTQKPWNRIPLNSRTVIMNSIIACLCGGRNKGMAAHAYNLLNEELANTGLQIEIPETILNVVKDQIPPTIQRMGGKGVIKVPYSNAGQGVYTIMNEEDLAEFMGRKQHYDKYLVQSLVQPYAWHTHNNSSHAQNGHAPAQNGHAPTQNGTAHKLTNGTGAAAGEVNRFWHIGTVPDAEHKSYVNDIRMMVCCGERGFEPISVYSRRARVPIEALEEEESDQTNSSHHSSSWDMLGTNLSVKTTEDGWDTEANRLILMDKTDFGKLDLGLEDLVHAYIQTILSVIAIDKLCARLVLPNGEFDYDLFKELNPDKVLLAEISV